MKPVRVVSLVPSVTESLLDWGIVPVAVTKFCEHPELAAVGGTKNPDITAVLELAPDVVVMCTEENRIEDAHALVAAGVHVHSIDIDDVDDVEPALGRLATELGIDPPSPAPLPAAVPVHTTVFVPIWRRPWMTVGGRCYGSSLLARLGFATAGASAADRYPTMDLDEARAEGVDLVLAPSEPYSFEERHRSELETVAPVRFVDGKDLFWWGVRTPGAMGRLASSLGDGRAGP